MALAALRAGSLEQVAQMVATDSLDLDATYPEEGHTTLLQTALHLGDHQAVALLLEHGAKPDRYNSVLKLAPIHVALGPESRATSATIALLVGALSSPALEARDWGGQTALHLAAGLGDRGLEVLELLLERGVAVGARDSRAGHTALDVAARADCWKAVERLARAGANAAPDTMELLEQRRPRSVASLGLRQAGGQQDLGDAALTDALFRQLPSSPPAAPSPAWQKDLTLATTRPAVLDLPTGGQTLVQVAAERGLVEHLELLLQAGASPTLATPGSRSALMLAAEAGRPEVLHLLLQHKDTRLEEVEEGSGRNVLLEVMSRSLQELNLTYQPDFGECLNKVLSTLGKWKDKQGCRAIVNLQDKSGNSALHYATQFWSQEVVSRVLKLGANVGLRNVHGEVAISNILPSTMADFLDTVALTSNNRNPTNENFSIKFDYSFLAPPESKPKVTADNLECCPLLPCSHPSPTKAQGGGGQEGVETEVLVAMARSPDHRAHLKHPVITSFLALKWSQISIWYNVNIGFIFLLVAILTSYIFANYAGLSLNVAPPGCPSNRNISNAGDPDQPHGNDTALRVLSIVFLFMLICRELLQFLVNPLKHLRSFENLLEVILIILIGVLLFHGAPGCHLAEKRELSSAIILISWFELLVMLGRHPTWHRCNIYSTMFFRVLATFLTFLLWYSLFIIAFGFGFFILLHSDTPPNSEDDKPKFFDNLGLALVKTFSMFVGELEFSEVPFQVSPRFSYLFFLAFVFLMVVVLMNLLNGLAVSWAEAEDRNDQPMNVTMMPQWCP